MSHTPSSVSAQAMLLATFSVRDALCAVDAAGVQEVIRLSAVTRVHHASPEVLGIVNLRGRIVTILDLGLTLGFAAAEPGPDSRVFIVEDHQEFIGLLVDRVGEVVEAESDGLEALPANVSRAQSRFFQGVCRAGGRVVTLIDVKEILANAL